MDRIDIPPEYIPFINALRDLIRTGAMAAPNLESLPLLDLPIVQRHSGPSASRARRAYTFIKILQQVIAQRLDGKEAQTANILFGFEGYAGVPIQDRYRTVAKLFNPYWTWENYRKEPLTRHLLAVYLALKREADIDGLAMLEQHPRKARSGLVGQDWLLERFDTLYTLPDQKGQSVEVVQTRRLRAVCDSIDTYRHEASLRERGISGVPHITLLGPGIATVIDTYLDPANGLRVYVTEIKFPEPVRYGESIDFTLIKKVDVELGQVIQTKGRDWYGVISLPSPAEHVKVTVRFPESKLPRTMWRYEDIISGLIRPGAPTTETRLHADESGYVSSTWNDLSAGYSYGISMEW